MRDFTLWLTVNNPMATPPGLGAKAKKHFASLPTFPPPPQPHINKEEEKLGGRINDLLKNCLQVRAAR